MHPHQRMPCAVQPLSASTALCCSSAPQGGNSTPQVSLSKPRRRPIPSGTFPSLPSEGLREARQRCRKAPNDLGGPYFRALPARAARHDVTDGRAPPKVLPEESKARGVVGLLPGDLVMAPWCAKRHDLPGGGHTEVDPGSRQGPTDAYVARASGPSDPSRSVTLHKKWPSC